MQKAVHLMKDLFLYFDQSKVFLFDLRDVILNQVSFQSKVFLFDLRDVILSQVSFNRKFLTFGILKIVLFKGE